jgi:hypothetical protein
MNTKSVQMEKRPALLDSDSEGYDRRRAQRRSVLGVLHGICLKLESMQTTPDARLACREVAAMLKQARKREAVRPPAPKR